MFVVYHYKTHDTSIIEILHCIKLTIAVSILYITITNTTNEQLPCRTLLSHNIMSAPLAKKVFAFGKPKGRWHL